LAWRLENPIRKGEVMNTFGNLSHSRWDCKYHVVFVPKCRRKSLYGKIREYLKQVFHELARQRGCQIVEGYIAIDHVHMCLSIPPKYSVSEVVGYMKGKSAIAVARQFSGREKNFNGECFWARGYAVSTVGFELDKIRDYIRHQERLDNAEDEGRF
jgi:putative transposase